MNRMNVETALTAPAQLSPPFNQFNQDPVASVPFAPLGGRPRQFDQLWHLEADLLLDDLEQRNIGRSQISGIRHERTAQGAGARGELADAARNEVDQNVGIANFLQGFFCEFGVQGLAW